MRRSSAGRSRSLPPVLGWLVLASVAVYAAFALLPGLTRAKTFTLSLDQVEAASAAAGGIASEAVLDDAELEPDPELQTMLDGYQSGGTVAAGIVVFDLSRGKMAASEADRSFVAASLYKLFVAQRLYALRESGLDFSQKLTINGRAVEADSGTLIWPVGTKVSIQLCLERMITVSDNACGVLLGDLIGWGKADKALRESGYEGTSLGKELKTTPRDVASLLRAVAEGKMVSERASADFLALLSKQRIRNRLPAQLPRGAQVAHKTGDISGLVHDAGIVRTTAGNRYVVAVLTGPWPRPAEAAPSIARLSRQIYDYTVVATTD
jgi:beta-lactamase class A